MLQVNLACCTIPGHSSLPDRGALSEGGKQRNMWKSAPGRLWKQGGLKLTADIRNGVWRGERVCFSSRDHGPALHCTVGMGIGDRPCQVG